MSNYPNQLDDDVSLPRVDDDITQEGGTAINATRDAIFNLEGALGTGVPGGLLQGTSLTSFLAVSFDLQTGHLLPSVFVSLPALNNIIDAQVSPTAGIKETKLALDYPTASLYNIMNNINTNVDVALNFITNHGSKLEPHLVGANFRHTLDQIDINSSVSNYLKNRYGFLRNNTNLYDLVSDINFDLVAHEKADGTALGANPTLPSVGTIPPVNFAHVSTGLYVNTSNFSFIPQTAISVQDVLQFIDNSNILILGTRIQTLYQNGISRSSRSTVVTNNTQGQLIVPTTPVTTYHLDGGSSSPVDNISDGDDIVQFFPTAAVAAANLFDAQFSLVKVGDILTVNYGNSISISSIIKEVKYTVGAGPNPPKTYMVRINSKNLFESSNLTATVTRSLVNTDKYGVLAVSQAQPPTPVNGALPSLVVGSPRGAEVLGIGFNPELLDAAHYNLYLVLYPDGNPLSSTVNLAPIDVTGNQGQTPGQYTLDSVVATVNAAFRTPGYNYRFTAYQYQGNFGIMLADSFGGASFSIVSNIIGTDGLPDYSLTGTIYPVNVIDGYTGKDALGFGGGGANVASPPFQASFGNTQIAQTPTKIFVPLTRKTFYVNGVERERLNTEPFQLIDGYGDGYWSSFIVTKQIIGPRVRVTYQVNENLSTSGLAVGKTLVVQPEGGSGSVVDFGRFFIESIQFNSCNCDGYSSFTTISVYDGIHGTGVTPYVSAPAGTKVRLYFSGDSVGFSSENAGDGSTPSPTSIFKRHFEVYVNEDGYTFTHERGRMNISGANTNANGVTLYSTAELSYLNIYKISPKLRGYNAGGNVTKISLQITSYITNSGVFSGYLCFWDGATVTHRGPTVVGKKGQVVRFYDETNIDYIDFIFNSSDSIPAISTTKTIDIQLYPSLSLDDQVMLLSTVQVNDSTKQISYLNDAREFGNVSEKQLSTSALNYIAAPTRFLNENGIIQGFDVTQIPSGSSPYLNTLVLNGGVAVVNGKIVQMNNETIAVPVVQEVIGSSTTNTISWFVCVNDRGEFELVASTDFDPLGGTAAAYATAGLDHTRLFTVQNPSLVTPVPYVVRGSYLSDIVQNQKDIAVIGILTSTISLIGSAYVITASTYADARRYVYNGYGNLAHPLILGSNASFRNFSTLNTWIDNLTKFKSSALAGANVGRNVIVKGNINISSTVILNYTKEIIFEGDDGYFTVSTGNGFQTNNNVRFKNLTFNYVYDPVGASDSFFSTSNLANPGKGLIYCPVNFNNNTKNISIENCVFTTPNRYHFPFITFYLGTGNSSFTSAIAENVNIVGNQFLNTYTGDDKQCIIGVVGNYSFSPSQLTGGRLINWNIQNNICDKNQMIMISSYKNGGSGTILDALVGVNLRITNNTCGAINVLVKRDVPTNTYNTYFANDKVDGTTISGNVCKFIYNGYADGKVVDSANERPILRIATGIFTGTLYILNNFTSFIHVGYRIPSTIGSGSPPLVIKDNKLTAIDSSTVSGYLNDYYTNGTAYIAPTYIQTGTALIIDKVVGS